LVVQAVVEALTNLPLKQSESLRFRPFRPTLLPSSIIMPTVKWTSKRGKELANCVQNTILEGDYGNIFEPGFDPTEFDYKELRESEEEWVKAFSQKQFQQNVKKMIERLIEEHGRADAEAADLTGGRGGGFVVDDGDDLADDLEALELWNHKKVLFPFKIIYSTEIGTGTKCATLIVVVPGGQYYVKIVRKSIFFELVTEPTLYHPSAWLALLPQLDSLAGGPFLAAFEEEGKTFLENPDDFEYPDRIRHVAEYPIKFDIEQNFQDAGRIPAWKEFPHANGSKTLIFNVVELRSNQHSANGNNKYFPQPPQQPFGYPTPPQQQQQQLQPQPSFPFGPAAQYVSPQVQQYMSPPVQQQQQQQQQQQYQPPVTQYKAPPKAPPAVQVHRVHIQDPNKPTPGVPKAAGLKNMSMDTEFTEETVTEEETPKTPSFFRRVASTLTGQSSDSSVSAHMKPPPKKYYVETVTSETDTETETSTSL